MDVGSVDLESLQNDEIYQPDSLGLFGKFFQVFDLNSELSSQPDSLVLADRPQKCIYDLLAVMRTVLENLSLYAALARQISLDRQTREVPDLVPKRDIFR